MNTRSTPPGERPLERLHWSISKNWIEHTRLWQYIRVEKSSPIFRTNSSSTSQAFYHLQPLQSCRCLFVSFLSSQPSSSFCPCSPMPPQLLPVVVATMVTAAAAAATASATLGRPTAATAFNPYVPLGIANYRVLTR